MATGTVSGVLRHLRRAVLLRDGDGMADGQLLECFLARREEEVPVGKLPEKIMAALKAKFPGAELIKAEKSLQNEEIIFEVVLKHKDKNLEVELKADSTILGATDLDAEKAKQKKKDG